MDSSTVFRRLFRIEIRRLLLIIGLLVGVIVSSQFFSFQYGKALYVSLADKGSNTMNIVDAGSSNSSKSTDIPTVQVFPDDSEDDIEYENEPGHEDDDSESAPEIENNTGKKVMFENDANISVGFRVEPDLTSGNVSPREEVAGFGLGGIDESSEKYTDPTTSPKTTSAELSDRTAIVLGKPEGTFIEGMRNSSAADFEGRVEQVQTKNGKTEVLRSDSDDSAVASKYEPKARTKKPTTLSQMHSLLLRSSVSSGSMKPRWSPARDRYLLSAKLEIENAPIIRSSGELSSLVFRNVSKFKRSYELMERILKVYVYKEGGKPVFHQPYMRGIYASEGWFMKLMEANKKFVVRDPKKAHLFYLPFSSKVLRFTLNKRESLDKKNLEKYLKKYVDLISRKYRFWNRTDGADHFLVACHDWASYLTRKTMKNCIRSLCNANVAKDFKIGKDTGFPVTYVRSAADPLENVGGKPASERPILAFFAGGLHGYLRPILLRYWENKEPDMKIFGPMPRDIEGKRAYREYMKTSRYCICARGYQVHTPRVVESIFYECVPVIISDNYVPPFFEVLNWEAFSVFVMEKDVPNLRNILLSIPKERYESLQSGVKMVQKHFFWHKVPVKYDLFHMTLHSVWNNRLLQVKPR